MCLRMLVRPCSDPACVSRVGRISRTGLNGLRWLRLPVGGALWLASACYVGTAEEASGGEAGATSGGQGSDEPTDSGSGTDGPSDACEGAPSAGPAGLKRLTRTEYNNLVRDLTGDERNLADGFGADGRVGRFAVNADAPVSEVQLEQYMEAAETIAEAAVTDLPAILECDPVAVGEDACASAFLSSFGRRAYRRPLDQEQLQRLLDVFGAARNADGATFSDGIRVAIQMVLQSPSFLYHLEFGLPSPQEGDVVALDPYETAARLSFFLWMSGPDEVLFAAAEAGELSTAEQVGNQAIRMLSDPRARTMVRTFYREWLGLEALREQGPRGTSLIEDTLLTLDEVTWEGEGTLDGMFTVTHGYLDGTLRELYGVEDSSADPAGFSRYELDPAERVGILTRAAFLAANSPPTGRGRFVRTDLLCGSVPPPPPGVDTDLPPADPSQSPRARWEQHVADPVCGSCHLLMDPLGFGFDHYDREGRYRTEVAGWPVDASGEIVGTSTIDGSFTGAAELQQRLASSEDVRECVARQWMRFATGREIQPDADGCSVETVNETFAASGYDIRTLLVEITKTDAFRLRRR